MMSSRNSGILLVRYAAAVLVVVLGAGVAMAHFPGGFDWTYTVISKLASRKHNPGGGVWLSAALLLAVLLVWPAAGQLGRAAAPRAAVVALRVGFAGAGLLALEGIFSLDISHVLRKGHELVALCTLMGMYGGVLGVYGHRMRSDPTFPWPALLVVGPLLAIGASQLALYFGQRELGWVNTGWRELGVPLWLSFAFWQWLAVALLGLALGHLIATNRTPAPAGPPEQRRL